MNTLKILLAFLAFGMVVFSTSTILIFDDSGSMADTITGSSSTKIDMAKQAANTFLNNVRAGDEVSLIVFYDCGDIKTEVPFTTDTQQIRTVIDGLTPQYSTPIAKAIDYASSYAQTSGRSGAQIILLTDGEETCDSQSDAVTAATNAVASNIKVINVVGLGLGANSTEAANDQEIATAGKGGYYPANDVGSLTSSLTQAYGNSGSSTCCLSSLGLPAIVGAALFLGRKR
jgi:Mg-chelatase subunit ChlD